MTDIETLTDQERAALAGGGIHGWAPARTTREKALRIIDALTEALRAAAGPCYARWQAAEARVRVLQSSVDTANDDNLRLQARVRELEGMLDDAGRGSTHELVRYWLEKTIAAEAESARILERIAKATHG
jgi:hypothetical protein